MYNINTISTKLIYEELIKNRKREPTCVKKWSEIYPDFHTAGEDLWSNIYKTAFNITRETYLQTFQYKLIHRLIVCQKKLNEMKLADNPTCLYCNELDDLRHFFLFCLKSKQFWNSFFNWWNSLGDIEISPHYESLEESILFGFQIEGGPFTALNYCILLAKHYLYCQKIHNANAIDFYQYLVKLKYKLKIESIICSKQNMGDFERFAFVYDQL
jgi:hypothetical protein